MNFKQKLKKIFQHEQEKIDLIYKKVFNRSQTNCQPNSNRVMESSFKLSDMESVDSNFEQSQEQEDIAHHLCSLSLDGSEELEQINDDTAGQSNIILFDPKSKTKDSTTNAVTRPEIQTSAPLPAPCSLCSGKT